MKIHDFWSRLLGWYDLEKRPLPWRSGKNPYFIWLSEIILQQTRVNQGISYYLKFTERYPTVNDLASASEIEVLKLWEGLGYYSRARNLLYAAKQIVNEHHGIFPQNFHEIKALKGIGEYTAAAIASIAFGKAHAVIDGNVNRFISRLFGIKSPIDSLSGKKDIAKLANRLLFLKDPGSYNQAMMEYGALICKPVNPGCRLCLFQPECKAYQKNMVHILPLKSSPVKIKLRYFHFLIFHDPLQKTLISVRNQQDIWKGLYQFPLVESEGPNLNNLNEILGFKPKIRHFSKPITHLLTHQKIIATFWHIDVDHLPLTNFPDATVIESDDLRKFPLPRLIVRYLEHR